MQLDAMHLEIWCCRCPLALACDVACLRPLAGHVKNSLQRKIAVKGLVSPSLRGRFGDGGP